MLKLIYFQKNAKKLRVCMMIIVSAQCFAGVATEKKINEEASDEDDEHGSSRFNIWPSHLSTVANDACLLSKGVWIVIRIALTLSDILILSLFN